MILNTTAEFEFMQNHLRTGNFAFQSDLAYSMSNSRIADLRADKLAGTHFGAAANRIRQDES